VVAAITIAVVFRRRAIIGVEDDAHDLCGIDRVQRFREHLPRCPVRGDDHQEAVDPSFDETAIRQPDERRSVDQHEVVLEARFPKETFEP
jgi:hypothetical protein